MFKIKSKPGCPSCENAKALITLLEYGYDEQVYDTPESVASFKHEEGFATFPQIWRRDPATGQDFYIGGFDSLRRAVQELLRWD